MFQWDATGGRPGRRFAGLFGASVAAHALVLFGGVGLSAYQAARGLSMFRWDDDPSYTNSVKVAKVSTAKLSYPSGFFAVKDDPKEIKKPEEHPKPKPAPEKKAERPKKVEEPEKEPVAGEEIAKADEPEKPAAPMPPSDGKFGVIRGNMLKPHLQKIYAAYEDGRLPDGPFQVTVTCNVAPDGALSNIKVVKSSGDTMIDETAMNLFKELSAMRALQPIAKLSTLSLTLDRGAAQSTLTAVGFAGSESDATGLNTVLSLTKFAFQPANDDQRALLGSTKISQAGKRLSVSCSVPNSRASEMMKRSFGPQSAVATAPKPSA